MAPSSEPTPSAHVLLVEDDAVQVALLTALLEAEGYRVARVATGAAAADLAELERPDLVVMDVGLEGGMDGVEAAVIVRKRTGLPVVFLTGRADRDTLARAREAEPFGYILKPPEPAQLRATLEIALDAARREAERRRVEAELEEARRELAKLRDR